MIVGWSSSPLFTNSPELVTADAAVAASAFPLLDGFGASSAGSVLPIKKYDTDLIAQEIVAAEAVEKSKATRKQRGCEQVFSRGQRDGWTNSFCNGLHSQNKECKICYQAGDRKTDRDHGAEVTKREPTQALARKQVDNGHSCISGYRRQGEPKSCRCEVATLADAPFLASNRQCQTHNRDPNYA